MCNIKQQTQTFLGLHTEQESCKFSLATTTPKFINYKSFDPVARIFTSAYTDEYLSLRIKSFAIIKLRGVSTKLLLNTNLL